ncbi:hypothetical protein AXX17_ATUG04080 (mitochondrion) [Arabidopsis thaliana]|uniref:Uncharacterized protein n=1 Tax=Arabidopsis thaliana TaxID=3702 RepID=A0A178U5H5_ARATH|nr:hypothetical protein AXX17_ATUG04080 [Arabidopsis thaliana]
MQSWPEAMKVALSREEVLLSEESQLSGEEKLAENKGYDDSDLQGSILHRNPAREAERGMFHGLFELDRLRCLAGVHSGKVEAIRESYRSAWQLGDERFGERGGIPQQGKKQHCAERDGWVKGEGLSLASQWIECVSLLSPIQWKWMSGRAIESWGRKRDSPAHYFDFVLVPLLCSVSTLAEGRDSKTSARKELRITWALHTQMFLIPSVQLQLGRGMTLTLMRLIPLPLWRLMSRREMPKPRDI